MCSASLTRYSLTDGYVLKMATENKIILMKRLSSYGFHHE